MKKLLNSQDISQIIMHPTAITKCQIGQDWFRNQFEVVFVPCDCYPDYMEVESFIMDEIDGRELNIEDAVNEIYRFLLDNYNPSYLKIIDHIRGCKTHFDVDVIKEM